MPSAMELTQHIGKLVRVRFPKSDMWFLGRIEDCKYAYGNYSYKIVPANTGEGSAWMTMTGFEFD